jgi:hypothetical protein
MLNDEKQDQLHTQQMMVRNEGIKRASAAAKRLGLDYEKIWIYNSITRDLKPDHKAMNGKEADENGIFTLPDGTKTEAPGLTGKTIHDSGCACSVVWKVKGL